MISDDAIIIVAVLVFC